MKRIIFLFGLVILTSCTYNELAVCETDNPSFSECIMPIFSEHCIECHFHNNPYSIMPLTNFTEIQDKIINGTIIESINREIGFMPKDGKRLSVEQILIIEKWYENGTPNN
ncbi:MAG TPA: hypothetical protein EYQ09_02960 [Flavobacteriales bacterium]|nr:hypothetical protein [Flavobacteriales bacterium]HIK63308.1 hypothetical protein [Flavobacteriales bacterium]